MRTIYHLFGNTPIFVTQWGFGEGDIRPLAKNNGEGTDQGRGEGLGNTGTLENWDQWET